MKVSLRKTPEDGFKKWSGEWKSRTRGSKAAEGGDGREEGFKLAKEGLGGEGGKTLTGG